MKKSLQISLLAIAAVAFLGMNDTQAAGAYVGANIGQGSTEVDGGGFDASDTAFKVQGGYRFMKHFALEADYRDLGTARDDAAGVEASASSIDMFAVGLLPIGSSKWELFGKVGASAWEADMELVGVPASQVSDDGTDLALGLGVAYEMKKMAFRMEYETMDTADDTTSNMVSAGFEFRF